LAAISFCVSKFVGFRFTPQNAPQKSFPWSLFSSRGCEQSCTKLSTSARAGGSDVLAVSGLAKAVIFTSNVDAKHRIATFD